MRHHADLLLLRSLASTTCPLRLDSGTSNGDVNNWRTIDLRYHHKLYDVFPGRARFLNTDVWI